MSASAFRRDAQVATNGSRIYVLLPKTATARSVTSWVRGTISALATELGVQLRAAIAAPVAGLAGVAAARAEVDRVLDSAERHPAFAQVTSLAEARTTVLLDEIVTLVGSDQRLVDRGYRPARAGSAAVRNPAGLPGQLRGHRRRCAVAAGTPEHRSLSGAPDREAAVHLTGRSRSAASVFAGTQGVRQSVRNRLNRSAVRGPAPLIRAIGRMCDAHHRLDLSNRHTPGVQGGVHLTGNLLIRPTPPEIVADEPPIPMSEASCSGGQVKPTPRSCARYASSRGLAAALGALVTRAAPASSGTISLAGQRNEGI